MMLVAFVAWALVQETSELAIGHDRLTVVARKVDGRWVEEVRVPDREAPVLVTPGHPLAAQQTPPSSIALRTAAPPLVDGVPDWAFTGARLEGDGPGATLVLTAHTAQAKVERRVRVRNGETIVEVVHEVEFPAPGTPVRSALCSYVAFPGAAAQPLTALSSPVAAGGAEELAGDHLLGMPMVRIARAGVGVGLEIDPDWYRTARVLPVAVDLDLSSAFFPGPVLTVGLVPHGRAGGRFVHASTDRRAAPERVSLAYRIVIGEDRLWERWARPRLNRAGPQTAPFEEYPRLAYPAAFEELLAPETPAWFEREEAGRTVGAVASRAAGTTVVRFGADVNALRSAWGMRYWGMVLRGNDWRARADKVLELALSAPAEEGLFSTVYWPERGEWTRSWEGPDPDRFDLAAVAATGYWLLRHVQDFPETPRREEVVARCRALGERLMALRGAGDGAWGRTPGAPADPATSAWVVLFFDRLLREGDDAAVRSAREAVAEMFERSEGSTVDWSALRRERATTLGRAIEVLAARGSREDAELLAKALADLQSVWDLPSRPGMATFGAVRPALDSLTLVDFTSGLVGASLARAGAAWGDRELFERGVAAVRATLALLRTPLNELNRINAELPVGSNLAVASFGDRGTNEPGPRRGFDEGEGAILASLAELAFAFGDAYRDVARGWEVGIDGVRFAGEESLESSLWENRFPWTGPQRATIVRSDGTRVEGVLARPPLGIRYARLEPAEAGSLRLIAVPSFTEAGREPMEIRADFLLDGRSREAEKVPTGFGVRVSPEEARGPLAVAVREGAREARHELQVWLDPRFAFGPEEMASWHWVGSFPEVPARPIRAGRMSPPFLGTGEDGLGGRDPSQTGVISSPVFLLTGSRLEFTVAGDSDPERLTVELVGAEDGEVLLFVTGPGSDEPVAVSWDVSALRGKEVFVRVVDRSPEGLLRVGPIAVEP